MKKLSQTDLKNIIERHRKFLGGMSGGMRATLKFTDLSGLDFRLADLTNADFCGARLNGANLSQGVFTGASFFYCDIHKADMQSSAFIRTDFRGARIIGSNLSEADFTHADFRQGYMLNYTGSDADAQWGQSGQTEFAGSTIRNTDLTNVMARCANFSDANLQGVTIRNADLHGADLSGANLTDTDFTGSAMRRTKFDNAIVDATKLDGVTGDISPLEDLLAAQQNRKKLDRKSKRRNIANMIRNHSLWIASAGSNGRQLNLSGYDLSRETAISQYPLSIIIARDCKFTGLNLEGVSMQSSILDDSDFQDCAAGKADFRGSSFKNARFTRADLEGADFSLLKVQKNGETIQHQPVNLRGANLAYAKLAGASFKGADLTGANLTHADLQDANLTGAELTGAALDNADLTGAKLPGPPPG